MEKKLKHLCQEHQRENLFSYPQNPANDVIQFASFLEDHGLQGGEAIDLGCGKGVNALYLAQHGYKVVALDLSKENIEELNQKAMAMKLSIKGYCQYITMPWPVKNNQFDAAIDISCYKHIVDKDAQKSYRQHLHAALKNSGYYLLSLASDEDGFYKPLLASSPDPASKLVIDPFSQIPSRLYSLYELAEEFSDDFQIVHAKKIEKISALYGKDYQSQTLSIIFQKKFK